MFGSRILKSQNSPEGIDRLREALDKADAVVIGAGAGLSTSAGFVYTGERFDRYFHDFAEKYHFNDMYSGGFYPYDTLEEHWAYWSRYIYINRYLDAPKPVYEKLLSLLKGKDYFVLTTNVDHCFQKAGFDKKRLFYTQGDYGLWQCSVPCHKKTYDNEKIFRQMMEDEGWHTASERYADFLRRHKKMNTLFLELGTGMNTPAIVKFSFWRMVHEWPDAVYACINLNEAYAPKEIQNNSICVSADIGEVLNKL